MRSVSNVIAQELSVYKDQRLTQRGTDYIASFRTHTGRWEPLPGEGDISTMSAVLIDLLEPYLTL